MLKFLFALAMLLSVVSHASAQTTSQFPTNPWVGYAPAEIQCGKMTAANMNSTADQAITISVPSGAFTISSIIVSHPSISLTTAQGGFYTAASKGGTPIVASSQAYSGLTTSSLNSTGSLLSVTLASGNNTTEFGGYAQGSSKQSTIYFALTNAQGAAATANIRVFCRALY